MRPHAPAALLLTTALAAGLLAAATGTPGPAAPALRLAPLAQADTSVRAAPGKPHEADALTGDDFDGDGFRDYAYGVPDSAAGAVEIVYGTEDGPGERSQLVDQETPGVPGVNERGDDFGGHLAAADFDGDGYGDLAVAAAYEKVGNTRYQGAVTLLWGSADGLEDGTTLPNKAPASWGLFGRDLAAGDFDGDGGADLAVINHDTAYLYRGGLNRADGLSADGSATPLERSGLHARSLVPGRVTGTAATDLVVVGSLGSRPDATAGAWFVKGGATPDPGPTLRLRSKEASGFPVTGTVADFDADGYGDIALGHSYADDEQGAVVIWPGGRKGPVSSKKITQATEGVIGDRENGDQMGSVLSAADIDGDGHADLAVGVDGEDTHLADTGGLHVLYGSPTGLTGARSQWIALDTPGVGRPLLSNARFGAHLRLRDADHDGHADLFTDGFVLPGTSKGIAPRPRESVRSGFAP